MQPRTPDGRFVSQLGIDAPARTIWYRETYNALWLATAHADEEKQQHLRERRQRNTEAWRRRKRSAMAEPYNSSGA